jgi:hypothetical protein
METIALVKETSEIVIRLAKYDDINAISTLNRAWLNKGLLSTDKKDGFLFGDPLSTKDIRKIIAHKELVVSYDKDKLTGYYLLDNHSHTVILSQHKKHISNCLRKGVIPHNTSISYRMQCAVDRAYQMRGLSRLMFNELLENTWKKYDMLFATVAKSNPKSAAHLKVGWEITDTVDDLYLLTYKV